MPAPRHWRPITWFIVVVNAIFPLWVLHGMRVAELPTCGPAGCTAAGQGSSPLVGLLLTWLIADLFLGVAWALSLPRPQGTGPSPYS